jgi:2-aminoadipate transaminase
MATKPFDLSSLYSDASVDLPTRVQKHAKYDFATAQPDPNSIPFEGLTDALKTMLDKQGTDLAFYPHAQGIPELRELIAAKLERDDKFKVSADDIVVVNGSAEANFVLIKALINPGDTVIMEHYVYSGTLSQMRKAGADVIGTPIDEDSIIPEEFEALVNRLTAEGRVPKLLYTIPEFQNPTGATLPTERREQIIEICRRHHIAIFEDECYTDLRYEGETQTSFRALDDSGMVSYVGSMSKILAPGLRLGYYVAEPELLRRAMSFRHTGTNHFTSLAVTEYLNREMYPHIDHINEVNRPKRDAMVSALGEYFGGTGTTWTNPKGSLYLWVTFPEHVNATDLMPIAFEAGVGFNSGASFAPNGDGDHCARLCFGYETVQKNSEGVALLAEVMEREGSFNKSPGN